MMSARHSEEPLEDLKIFPDAWAAWSTGGRGRRNERVCEGQNRILRELHRTGQVEPVGQFHVLCRWNAHP